MRSENFSKENILTLDREADFVIDKTT